MTSDIPFVSIRVWHPHWNADAISKAIGLSPSTAHDVNSPRQSPHGFIIGGQYKESYCVFEVNVATDNSIQSIVSAALKLLSAEKIGLQRLVETGGRSEIHITASTSSKYFSIDLPLQTIQECSSFGVSLWVECYCDEKSFERECTRTVNK